LLSIVQKKLRWTVADLELPIFPTKKKKIYQPQAGTPTKSCQYVISSKTHIHSSRKGRKEGRKKTGKMGPTEAY
jgi:hypothetical protein